jgi:hypothetical protein
MSRFQRDRSNFLIFSRSTYHLNGTEETSRISTSNLLVPLKQILVPQGERSLQTAGYRRNVSLYGGKWTPCRWLFHDAVSIQTEERRIVRSVINDELIFFNEAEVIPQSRYYPSVFLKGLRKATKDIS